MRRAYPQKLSNFVGENYIYPAVYYSLVALIIAVCGISASCGAAISAVAIEVVVAVIGILYWILLPILVKFEVLPKPNTFTVMAPLVMFALVIIDFCCFYYPYTHLHPDFAKNVYEWKESYTWIFGYLIVDDRFIGPGIAWPDGVAYVTPDPSQRVYFSPMFLILVLVVVLFVIVPAKVASKREGAAKDTVYDNQRVVTTVFSYVAAIVPIASLLLFLFYWLVEGWL